jgi:hypothetical protein
VINVCRVAKEQRVAVPTSVFMCERLIGNRLYISLYVHVLRVDRLRRRGDITSFSRPVEGLGSQLSVMYCSPRGQVRQTDTGVRLCALETFTSSLSKLMLPHRHFVAVSLERVPQMSVPYA